MPVASSLLISETEQKSGIGSKLFAIAGNMIREYRLRSTEQCLSTFSDYQLSDIGICRSDIPCAIRRFPEHTGSSHR